MTINMAFNWPRKVHFIYGAILLTALLSPLVAAGQQHAPVATGQLTRILIPNLPPGHYQYWLKNNPSALKSFEKICSVGAINDIKIDQFRDLHSNFEFEDRRITTDLGFRKEILEAICSKIDLVKKSCWGYETNCDFIYLMPECNQTSEDSRSEQEKKIDWFTQADFGYILDRRRELQGYCMPDKHSNHTIKSSLQCTKYFRTCRGENLYVNFDNDQSGRNLRDGPLKLNRGKIGGWNCDLQKHRIQEQSAHRGHLRSWFDELEHYDLMRLEPKKACKKRIEEQVYLIQLDSSANMYHYFCNFLNLYATMHLNNRFSENNQLILWQGHQPSSPFEVMWEVFSKNPPKSLNDFKNEQVCLNKFIFTMPPRMIDGLYYSTPLVEGCSKSGLFDAFNKHVLYKLGIDKQDGEPKTGVCSRVRVTIISRSTPTRKILNENDLRIAADGISTNFQTQIVDFANLTFKEQLGIVHTTDILVGIHGAGLTHTLFLPDWAALLELYDCQDGCYRDLARLRGVSYFTLKDGQNSGRKSDDFPIDVDAFIETIKSAAHEVKRRKAETNVCPEVDSKIIEKEDKSNKVGVRDGESKQEHTEL